MPIKQVVCCDRCEKVIGDSIGLTQGFAFVGNVHVVDSKGPDCVGGGVIGNNLSYEDDDQGESYAVVDTILYYCRDCAVKVLFGEYYELHNKDTALRDLGIKDSYPLMN